MSTGITTLLVVDDEPQIRKFLRISLSTQGFEVLEAGSAGEGLQQCTARRPDLIILDLGLPDADGHALIEAIRAVSSAPIIVLSVRADEAEKVAALDRGADDYVTKPFGIAELTARIRAALRSHNPGADPGKPIDCGPLHIDLQSRVVTLDGEPLKLSKKEFALLVLLAGNRGRVLTHRQLLRDVWGSAHEHDTHYLRVYIGQLRQKLGDDAAEPRFITNEPGVGYRFLE